MVYKSLLSLLLRFNQNISYLDDKSLNFGDILFLILNIYK